MNHRYLQSLQEVASEALQRPVREVFTGTRGATEEVHYGLTERGIRSGFLGSEPGIRRRGADVVVCEPPFRRAVVHGRTFRPSTPGGVEGLLFARWQPDG